MPLCESQSQEKLSCFPWQTLSHSHDTLPKKKEEKKKKDQNPDKSGEIFND